MNLQNKNKQRLERLEKMKNLQKSLQTEKKKLTKEINTLTKRAEKKQERIETKANKKIDTYRDIKGQSIQQLKKQKREIKKFTSERITVTEKGAIIKNKEYQKIKKMIAIENKRRKKEFTKIQKEKYRVMGKEQANTIKQLKLMGDKRYREFTPIKINKQNISNFEKFKKNIIERTSEDKHQARASRYKQSYIKALHNNLGDKAIGLETLVNKISDKDFLTLYYTEKIGDISYPYDFVAVMERVRNIEETLLQYIKA